MELMPLIIGEVIQAMAAAPALASFFVMIYVVYEFYHPKGRYLTFKEQSRKRDDRIILVVRALARANDGVAEHEVDDFLLNGSSMDEFLVDGIKDTEEAEDPDGVTLGNFKKR